MCGVAYSCSYVLLLKLKVLVTKGVLGSARGLTSSDALICCQVLVLILMADETDPARGLIRS